MAVTRNKKSKYFLAIVPPSPFYEEVLYWKNYFRINFNSKASLRSPPHITLHMPFEWQSEKEEKLITPLSQFVQKTNVLDVKLDGFGCFAPRVIFIQVTENILLNALQKTLSSFCKTELRLFNANRNDEPYQPHLTVAFRDLKKSVFKEAWDSVQEKSLKYKFTVNHISLLKHNGRSWDEYHDLKLNSMV